MLFGRLKTHDIFISYVVEDREIVNALVKGLTDKGLRVWYAHEQLQIGISVRETINTGLTTTRYGLVLISPKYKSYWAYGELHSLFTDMGKKRLLPILHNLTIEDIALEIPGIHDIYCGDIKSGTDSIIDKICSQIEKRSPLYYAFIDALRFIKTNKRRVLFWGSILIISLFIIAAVVQYKSLRPTDKSIHEAISKRLKSINTIAETEFKQDVLGNDTEQVLLTEVAGQVVEANRNDYIFYNGEDNYTTLAALKNADIIPQTGPIQPPFGLLDFRTYIFKNTSFFKIGLVNIVPTQHEIVDTRLIEVGLYEVDVKYKNPTRYINIGVYTDSSNNTTTRIVKFWGAKPNETLVFEKNDEDWQLLQIR